MIGELGDRIATLVQDNSGLRSRTFSEPGVDSRDITGPVRERTRVQGTCGVDRRSYAGRRRGSRLESRGFILGASWPPSWAWAC